MERWRRAWARLREFQAAQAEMQDRLWLLNHPWEEELLHWGWDGELHGRYEPPPGRRRYSVTRTGWCLGCRSPRNGPPNGSRNGADQG